MNRNVYKFNSIFSISSLMIVSMSPGDLAVAGCLNFSELLGGFG